MFEILKQFLKIVMAGLVSLLVLALVTYVYNFTGIHIKNPSGATDYKWESRQLKSNMTEGFSHFRMDDNGFNNTEHDFIKKEPDILLMGSSHMEAVQVEQNENTGYLLNKSIPNLSTYNIGVSGHTIYRCADNLKNAVNEYNPSRYVIIETNTTELDSKSVNQVIERTAKTIESYDKGILFLLQKYCPAVKCIYKQVVDWATVGLTSGDTDEKTRPASKNEVNMFLKKMKSDCGTDVKLIICYHPTYNINDKGKLVFEDSITSDVKCHNI